MVVPFGFSISDFIAITELTIKICRFTSASSGLRREVQTLASQYYELYELMQKAMGIHIQQDIDLEPSSKRCLEYHLSRCREHLRQFEQEITAITRASNADSVAKKAKQTGARLKLMIMHDSVLKKLNANFRHDLEAFKLCVDAVTANGDPLESTAPNVQARSSPMQFSQVGADGEPSIDTGLPLEQAQALQDDSTGTPDQPDHTQAPSPTPTPRTDPHDEDRESDLKRVTIVYSPIFSLVYRAASCMCRISGDESPFIESCDIMIWTPCRLHFPQAVAKALDVELEYPPQGYDPNEDPYFDRFGGRPAFVAWIATNTLVQKAIDVGTLLPEGMTWYEAARQLRIAGANESQKEALLDWQVQYHRQYIEWKSRYGKASDEKKAEMALRAKRGGAGPALERRGSF
ncbi:hypothetical protein PRZ48_003214 [Zasmidium cellare]|uniref:Uncharacterized protein n=1 Tax=Zasmidium cellare TaxID=395010 RepID=A0ABR0EVY3_ZASCE|nr:hypothetical protein PRZ48_003214 [Zasmidium cellare]